MPKLTYRAQTPDDPPFVKVGNERFEHGKAVTVSDDIAKRFEGNPWFTGGRDAKRQAEETVGGAAPVGDSSVNLAPPPGSGSKYDPGGAVATGEGLVPADDASLVDGANVVEDASDSDSDTASSSRKGRSRA